MVPERARYLAERLSRATVIGGDALDPEIFIEINIGLAQAVIAVSNDDEVNILAALLAKRAGCGTAISLVNNSSYGPLMGSLGVDIAVSPRESTVSTILQRIRRGRILAVQSIRDGAAEIIEAEALGTSPSSASRSPSSQAATGITSADRAGQRGHHSAPPYRS